MKQIFFSDMLSLHSNRFLAFRPEDHSGGPDPVGEEAVGCDDPHGVLPERVRARGAAVVHGEPAAEVCALAPALQ